MTQHIILGVTGGIAAYKSAELVRRFKEQGSLVRVVMTEAAKAFVTPLTFQALSEEPVYDQLLDEKAEQAMNHIALARWADWILVAPATADFIARLAHGHANDLLTTLCLATDAPIAIAPAMNRLMWENPATQSNIHLLRGRNIEIIGPDVGSQACGETGLGRMVESDAIIAQLNALTKNNLLQGKHLLITAGPTREPLDPIRYLTNKSSGKMGYALAKAASEAGAKVTLISGPVSLPCPTDVQCIQVETAQEMLTAVIENVPSVDIFIATAAVADYHVEEISKEKIKKTSDTLNLRLTKNPDILAAVATLPNRPFTVGFAAETHQVLEFAKKKLAEKKTDLIFANDVSQKNIGFDTNTNSVTALWNKGEQLFPLMQKTLLAKHLIELIAKRYYEKNPT